MTWLFVLVIVAAIGWLTYDHIKGNKASGGPGGRRGGSDGDPRQK